MEIIRAGVDSLYLAIKGTLPTCLLAQLSAAKEQALAERRLIPFTFPGGIEAAIAPNGATGGYAFICNTGVLGAIWSFRQMADKPDWNFFIKPHATALLARGFWPTAEELLRFIPQIGGQQIEHSINRIDYAIDVRADDFVPSLENFVAHPKSTRVAHWEEGNSNKSTVIFRASRIESVTIGRLKSGKQLILYDKTAEARAKQKPYFFDAWGIDPADKDARVLRIELRLGKRELKERRKITALGDLADKLRPPLEDLLRQVRYVLPNPADQNVSRQKPHPIWRLAVEHVAEAHLLGGAGDLEPARVLETTRDMAVQGYKRNLVGNAAGLYATLDLDCDAVADKLPDIVREAVEEAVPTDSFRRSLARARDKGHLIRAHAEGL